MVNLVSFYSSFKSISTTGGRGGYDAGSASNMYTDEYDPGWGFYLASSNGNSFEDITTQGGLIGFDSYQSKYNNYSDLNINGTENTGLHLSQYSDSNRFTDVSVSNVRGYEVYLHRSSSNTFTSLSLTNTSSYGGVGLYDHSNNNVFSTTNACTGVSTFSSCYDSTSSFSSTKCTSAGNCAGVSCQAC